MSVGINNNIVISGTRNYMLDVQRRARDRCNNWVVNLMHYIVTLKYI